MTDQAPLRLRLITDGKAGDLAQVMGVAEAVAALRPALIENVTVKPHPPYDWLMPWGPTDPRDAAALAPPYPDIAIASGRRAVASLRALAKRSPGTFTAFLKDPRTGSGTADFIWVPAHDRLRGPNVLVTSTGPHRFSKDRLEAERAAQPRTGPGPTAPRLTVLLGGPARGYDYTTAAAIRLAGTLRAAAQHGFDLFVTPSRRTPGAFVAELSERLAGLGASIWDGSSPNPYPTMLATADVIVAPADSHNMISEALASGVPVYVFHPDGKGGKLATFVRGLTSEGLVKPFDSPPSPDLPPRHEGHDVTGTIASVLLAGFDSKRRP